MRFIKLAIISLFFLLLLVTLISLLFPSEVRISKAIDLNHDKPAVIRLLADTNAWKRWHPSFIAGSRYYAAQPATYRLQQSSDSLVVMEVTFNGRHQVVYGWQFHHYQGSERYTLQWFADFKPGWLPWQRMGSLFYEKTYGVMMEQGLKNIDSVLTLDGSLP